MVDMKSHDDQIVSDIIQDEFLMFERLFKLEIIITKNMSYFKRIELIYFCRIKDMIIHDNFYFDETKAFVY